MIFKCAHWCQGQWDSSSWPVHFKRGHLNKKSRHTEPKKKKKKIQITSLFGSPDEANASTTGDKRRGHLTWAGTLLLGNEIKRQLLSEEALLRKEWGVGGSRGVGGRRGILSSQEIEAITSKLSSGPFGGQEQTNQFGVLLSGCQLHRRTPWHPIRAASHTVNKQSPGFS